MKSRINELRILMDKKGIDYYIIPTADSHGSEYIDKYFAEREYMTGFTGSAGTLIVSKTEAALFVDGRYHIQADEQVDKNIFTIYKIGEKNVPTALMYLAENVKDGETIGFDGRCFDVNTYNEIEAYIKNNNGDSHGLKNNMGDSRHVNFHIEDDLVDEIWKDRPLRSKGKVYALDDNVVNTKPLEKIKCIREYLNKHDIYG